jgi:hypothetical protein
MVRELFPLLDRLCRGGVSDLSDEELFELRKLFDRCDRLESIFRRLREEWFRIHVPHFPIDLVGEDLDSKSARLKLNNRLRLEFSENTERIIRGENGLKLAPGRGES